MKTLIMVRHAKSSWAEPGLSDFNRPLNDRGKKDGPNMARRLKKKSITIDLFMSSPAKRAKRTAELFADELEYPQDKILLIPELYEASVVDFNKVISTTPDSVNTIILFSHNPGITAFANTLSNAKIDNMPTCAVFAITMGSDKWLDFAKEEKKFLFFDYPKAL